VRILCGKSRDCHTANAVEPHAEPAQKPAPTSPSEAAESEIQDAPSPGPVLDDAAPAIPHTVYPIIFAIGFFHMLNDMMQSLLPAIYPRIVMDRPNDAVPAAIVIANSSCWNMQLAAVHLRASRAV